jgi:hypothetical protein
LRLQLQLSAPVRPFVGRIGGIELSTRGIEIAGVTSEPDHAWMSPVSRNVTDASDGFLTAKASGANCPHLRRIRFLVWPEFAGPGAKRSHARHQEQSENGEQGGDWEGDH